MGLDFVGRDRQPLEQTVQPLVLLVGRDRQGQPSQQGGDGQDQSV